MAAKKVYAVKKGKTTGIFNTWEACKASVDGYPGAEYKGFATTEEAIRYLGNAGPIMDNFEMAVENAGTVMGNTGTVMADGAELPPKGCLLAYVDGSYQEALQKYAFGCVFLLPDGRIYTEYGNGDNPESLQQRNVTGEMLGAMYAVRVAMLNGFDSIEIRYDYQGIEKWVTGEWRSKNNLTQKYAQSMREWGKSIHISFTKVAAHSNVRFNELADEMAKRGLTEADGVPKIKKLEEMMVYGTNQIE